VRLALISRTLAIVSVWLCTVGLVEFVDLIAWGYESKMAFDEQIWLPGVIGGLSADSLAMVMSGRLLGMIR